MLERVRQVSREIMTTRRDDADRLVSRWIREPERIGQV